MRQVSWMLIVLGVFWGNAWSETSERVQVTRIPHGGVVPDAEIDPAGKIHVAYVAGHDLYYVTSADEGKTFSQPIRVNSEAGTVNSGKYRGPDLAVGQNRQIHIIWYTTAYHRKLPQDQWGVYYSQLDSAKKAFLPSRNLNHRPSDNFSLAADSRGTLAVFWTADGLYVNLSRDGGKTFSEAQLVHPKADPCECCATRARFSSDETLFSLYRDKADNLRDMYVASLPLGKAGFSMWKISEKPWKIEACPMTGAFLSDGRDEGLVAAWETQGQVYFAHLNKSSQKLPFEEMPTPGEAVKKYPVILNAPDGVMLVAWKRGSQFEWQLYDAEGKPQGQLNWRTSRNPHRPAGVVTNEGKFLLFP